MTTPLALFTASGVAIILMVIIKAWQLRRGVTRTARPQVVEKVDTVIHVKTAELYEALTTFNGKTINRFWKRFLHAALVVILHTLHELRDLTQMFLDKVRKSDIKESQGQPSPFLRDVLKDKGKQL